MIPELTADHKVLGYGTDMADVYRFRFETVERRRSLFTEAELAYCLSKPDPAPHLAARFAAKEAVMKAMRSGIYDLDFVDIEVIRGPNQEPMVQLHGQAAELAHSKWIEGWYLSLSHTKTLAIAGAIAVGRC